MCSCLSCLPVCSTCLCRNVVIRQTVCTVVKFLCISVLDIHRKMAVANVNIKCNRCRSVVRKRLSKHVREQLVTLSEEHAGGIDESQRYEQMQLKLKKTGLKILQLLPRAHFQTFRKALKEQDTTKPSSNSNLEQKMFT